MIRFASAFAQATGSPIRELYPFLGRPGMISLAGGYPSPALFDAPGLAEAAAAVMGGDAANLQYGATEGHPRLKDELLRLGAARGMRGIAHEDLLITSGAQQGFDLLVRVLVQPGDTVLLETPAYPAAIQALRLAGARLLEVPMDAQGLDTGALSELLERAGPGAGPKLLYTVPNFSNPRGTLLSPARRDELLRLARRHGLLVVEDDPYGELCFDPDVPDTLYARAQASWTEANPVVYLSSLSKTVAPALRIGWMIGPRELLRRCAIAKQTTDLCTSALTQLIAAHYLGSGRYPGSLSAARREYARRVAVMAECLERELGGDIRFERPRGGLFLWTECACGLDPSTLFDAAVREGVLFVPGAAFFPEPAAATCMRLSFAASDVDAIREGVRRLARALRASLASSSSKSASSAFSPRP
jgi:DNA-binding transcriptional MocR family regulator